jgi:sec-independent protein translocase protein TatB
MARHFTAGIEDMVRQAELEEMEKRWREENERIMRLHPANVDYPEPGQPDTMPPIAEPPEPTLPFDETQPGDEMPPEKRPLP